MLPLIGLVRWKCPQTSTTHHSQAEDFFRAWVGVTSMAAAGESASLPQLALARHRTPMFGEYVGELFRAWAVATIVPDFVTEPTLPPISVAHSVNATTMPTFGDFHLPLLCDHHDELHPEYLALGDPIVEFPESCDDDSPLCRADSEDSFSCRKFKKLVDELNHQSDELAKLHGAIGVMRKHLEKLGLDDAGERHIDDVMKTIRARIGSTIVVLSHRNCMLLSELESAVEFGAFAMSNAVASERAFRMQLQLKTRTAPGKSGKSSKIAARRR